jgi:hypothetical protein
MASTVADVIISTYDAVGELGPLGFGHRYPLDTWDSHLVEKGEPRYLGHGETYTFTAKG